MRLAPLLAAFALALAGCSSSESPGSVGSTTTRADVEVGDAPALGPADAKVVLVEFGDFQCPYCGDVEPVMADLRKNYEGKVRFVFKQFPLDFHQYAELAAEASLAAHAQGKFWGYHDTLYANQTALERTDLDVYAQELGLDITAFRAALDDHTYAAAVQKDVDQGNALGVPGTPAFFVNGRLGVGALPYETLAAAIDEELAAAK